MEIGRQIVYAALAATAVNKWQYPADGKPEIVFAGKSNVGKSSLINAMLGRKKLARCSQTPGKTRTINFYDVEHEIIFVDLPGYGYAKVSKTESAKWGKMVESYIKDRRELAAVIMLLDIRHVPGANDIQLFEWFAHFEIPVILAATKSDKISRGQIQKNVAVIKKTLQSGETPVIPFSSENKSGRDELWDLILNAIDKKISK
ncbi:MAG: ribosome biogenesis GTP-binding protein YihA/YsxC [Defluviitaleaceae bacterium]|nr:ribosome biogenesis GTP-binding protein YihA/YsxC [Defluviitaleaceae bacterium]